ncbi:alanine--tRNA ligase [Solitalea canadensis]|uniref:Alanine--tRNA ligase n=1 Tax=Solitalea canadensis (strain ATCC 29591 / DSM 3403 / JCM 21819 / LMG 8368 / NBRC 15130 / NCIMB 12057 / USAM 9D) TaxID=929556 RepID=H8KQY5_SOLCM|nr:alanine--tRNA ligase [Solitalea canadensis]AFD07131.1 alanine--tRNA ligase [Solitalea canadensis DSM 3403]
MDSRSIRKAFLDFFESKGHKIVPSAPLVVKNDPTLMFVNSGMAPFKDIFLGVSPVKFPRVADTQKCLRVSGKHNDLEEVGIDTYHHTLFEMLGNWSFGDYFKKEAIQWAWELLTEVYKLPKDRLYVTVFEGDAKENLAPDNEALEIWKKYIAADRILYGNKKDNFWEMGDQGPCGPCSEIHIDLRSEEERAQKDGKELVNNDHPQVVEIWNNVFMEFNRKADGSLEKLPAQHVDTGMGFERLCMALQQKRSNYDTDVFQPMIQFIASQCGIAYGKVEKTDIAMRVMADHIRAIAFTITDGQLPSNTGAGYVIRRILRRAVRYSYTFLNFKEPFLYKLVALLAEQFDGVFNELKEQKSFVEKVVKEEEASFLRTLAGGIQRFEKYIADHKEIEGEFAFELYDTYGFPIDLTQLLARESKLNVDMDGFNKALEAQKNRSRAATAIDTGDWVLVSEDKETEFLGYDQLETEVHILKYRKIKAKGKEQYQLVLDKTPFYAEGGGQVGDTGVLENANELVRINDTKKENNLIVHFTDELPEDLTKAFVAKVDTDKRRDTANNHSATHLLHAALKRVLGDHVNQKGSLVNEEYLRFDFSHFAKVTDEEIAAIEKIVNEKIRENIKLDEQRKVPFQQAIDSGVTALFGEKYGDFVRVITFDPSYSKELCGGIHVPATGQIGSFKIVAESAVAAGVRRIEAITATKAEELYNQQQAIVNEVKTLLKNPKDVVKGLENVLEENNRLRKELEQMIIQKASMLKDDLVKKAESINGVNFIATRVDIPSAEAIKNLSFEMREKLNDLFLVIAAEIDGKPSISVIISDSLVQDKKLNASQIVRELGKEIQGGGGGQPFYATAGGKDASGLDRALEKAKQYLS